MSADSPRRSSGSASGGVMALPAIVPPQIVSDRSILDSAIGFINEVTLAHQLPLDPKDTITWARFETCADISDSRFGEDWELEGNLAPPLLLILGYGLGVQVWAIPANGEAVEVLSWRHGIVSVLRVLPTPLSTLADDENGRADEPNDAFGDKRPLIALVDGSSTVGSSPQFCAVNFISLKTAAQVKTIKFKNPVIDILANRSSIVITFHERIAVFDARTLEDRLTITTCYPSPGINPNPVALGSRWLAYAETKLLHTKRSGGGCDGDGVASYTATVLNASKSLVKGLRELGEQVAAGLTGTSGSAGSSKNTSFDSGCGLDTKQPGIVTIVDVKNPLRDYSPTSGVPTSSNRTAGTETMIAHFIAHSEALVAMEFDNSGMLLVTADRRGHDFHVFRIQPNPVGSSLAAVHHLYILHRGDTSSKVQNITLTLDSRWVAISTLRGTTHVFPITPYGGTMGVRTHSSLHVVNKLSRFHRSAGLSGEGRSNSPISHSESTTFFQSLQPYNNSTLPPFPRPTVVMPLAQLRQPFALGSPPGSASLVGVKSAAGVSGPGSQRQRLSSLSDDSGKPLSVCAIFAKSRSWLLDPPNVTREAPHRMLRKAVDSLFVMAGHGALIQYDLGTKLASNVAKEKICDDTPIELEVEAKAQWNLGRRKEGSQEIMPPLSPDNWLIKNRNSCMLTDSIRQNEDSDERSESWLSQVEIITHAGPHRRLWMGPQFVFKTYNTPSGSNLNHVDIEAVEIGTNKPCSNNSAEKLDHSSPLNMPLSAVGRSNAVPVLIESGSYIITGSIEQSPKLMDRFRHDHLDSDYSVVHGDSRLKEDLADAMRESPSAAASSKDAGGHVCDSGSSSDNVAFYDALTAEDDQVYVHAHLASAAALASVLPNIHSYENSSSYESLDLAKKSKASIEKIVNPLGTVTDVTSCLTADVKKDILDEVVSQLAAEDTIIHENCDESLFRPVVAIFCDEKTLLQNEEEAQKNSEKYQPPEVISNKLVVPVIAKDLNDELSKREKEKNSSIKYKTTVPKTEAKGQKEFEEMPLLNSKPKEYYKKPNNAKGNTGADKKDTRNNSQKGSSSVLKCETQETECWKTIPFFKETSSAEIKVIQNNLPKKVSHIQEKQSKELQRKTVDTECVVETELRKQNKKELQDCLDGSKETDLNVKNIVTKVEIIGKKYQTKPLSSNEKDKENKIRDTAKTSKENIDYESVNSKSTDLKLTASVPYNVNQKEQIKTKMVCDNVEKKPEPGFMPTPHTSTIPHTSIKEKDKKTKDLIKSNKLDTNDNRINNQFSIQQLADNIVKMENDEKNIKDNETREKEATSNKKENEKIISKTNPFVYEKKDRFKSKANADESPFTNDELQSVKMISSKDHDIAKTSESSISTIEKQGITQKENIIKERSKEASKSGDSVEPQKKEKTKAKDIINKEKQITQNYITEKLELDLSIHKIPILEDKNVKDAKSDPEYFNPKNESKDKSRKTTSEDEAIKKTISNEQQYSDSIKQNEENCGKIKQINNSGQIKKKKKLNSFEIEYKPESLHTGHENNGVEKKLIKQSIESTETVKIESKDETIYCDLAISNANSKDFCKETALPKMKQVKGNEVKTKSCHELLSDLSPNTKAGTNEIMKYTLAPNSTSPKKKGKESPKEDKKNFRGDTNAKELHESTLGVCGKAEEAQNKLQSPIQPPASAWKTLSGADMINKNLNKLDSKSNKFPLLGAGSKINNSYKLLPEIPTPADIGSQTNLDEFSVLKTLDRLPPLPALAPLQLLTENSCSSLKDISLITFESPLLETRLLQRKITPTPRGFTEENLIFALCGSLHYENEHGEKTEVSPTFSSNHSFTDLEETSQADYKSLTEIGDPYISLEQSSQDTNTTNTNTTNEKGFSSTNSSGSEEVVIMEEKKIAKKQKRKKQHQLKELQSRTEQNIQQEIYDEELRPLIAMTDSQFDQTRKGPNEVLPASVSTIDKNPSLPTHSVVYSTTTDSEGPLPATTSDDNVFSIPVSMTHNPNKIKTKKLEHKINLIAAIEAATSSSTSSAEESGIELGGRSFHENCESLILETNSISTSTIQLPIVVNSQTTAGALKKKTKRRKR